jgi:hypothetical protein
MGGMGRACRVHGEMGNEYFKGRLLFGGRNM